MDVSPEFWTFYQQAAAAAAAIAASQSSGPFDKIISNLYEGGNSCSVPKHSECTIHGFE
jgi:hypothetical protein